MEMEQKINLCGERYYLKWSNFTRNLIDVLKEKRLCEALTDVSIYCEGEVIKAHKIILAASSTLFEDMFKLSADKDPCIILNGVSLKYFKYMIEFIYNGEIQVIDSELSEVLSLGETMQIKGLSSVKVKENTSNSSKSHKSEKHSKNSRKSSTNKDDLPLDLPCVSKTIDKNVKDEQPLEMPNASKSFEHDKPVGMPSVSSEVQLKYVENSYLQGIAEGTVKWQKVDKNVKESGKNSITNPNENIPPKKRKIVEENDDEPQDLSNQASKPIKIEEIFSKPKVVSPQLKVEEKDANEKPLSLLKSIPQENAPQPPKNAFMIFQNEQRDRIAADNPSKSYKDISIMLGDMWKSLPEHKKQIYYSKADTSGTSGKSKFLNHYYSPKEYRKLKTTEKMSTTTGCVEIEISDDDPVETVDVKGETVNTIKIAPDFFC